MRISLIQMTAVQNPQENLAVIAQEIDRAAADGVRMLVFPEAAMRRFGSGFGDSAEPLDGPWATRTRELAHRANLTVVVGMFTPAAEGRVHNTLLVTGGGVDSHYDKIHLYDAFGFAESDNVAAGSEPLVLHLDGVGVGFATCYDIRFPGLFQTLADKGAQVIVVPASWARGPGKADQWKLLARARALDSTSFVLACDQADPEASGEQAAGPLGVGHSMVVGPDGAVVRELDHAPGTLTADLDLAEVGRVRKNIPVLLNRRY